MENETNIEITNRENSQEENIPNEERNQPFEWLTLEEIQEKVNKKK